MSARRMEKTLYELDTDRFPERRDVEWDRLNESLISITDQRNKLYTALNEIHTHVKGLEDQLGVLQGGGEMTEWDMCARAVGNIIQHNPSTEASTLKTIHDVLRTVGDPDATNQYVSEHLEEIDTLHRRVLDLETTNMDLRTETFRLRGILTRRRQKK